MSTQTLISSRRFAPFQARSKTPHPFLRALEHISYGRMTIATPEGKILEYTGPEKGPDAYLRLYDWDVLNELMARGEIGFAEAYIDERWETVDLPALITFALVNTASLERFFYGRPWYALWNNLRHAMRGNSLQGSRRNVMAHYDLGNEFYSLWLDKSMTYSCALFEGGSSRTLEEAQTAKYRRILRKLSASPGDHVLEIGCGWGGFAEMAARDGLRVTAVTLSEKQEAYARDRIRRAGLADKVRIELRDYREVKGTFDHIVSIGMFEHVGEKYWLQYFEVVKNRLRPKGTALVQCITLDDYLFESLHGKTGFIEEYIFPGGMLPSKSRFHAAASKAGLMCREMYAFGQDYAHTTREWLNRFESQREEVKKLGCDEAFLRLWRFYLASCVASFTSHRTDVIQAELTHAE